MFEGYFMLADFRSYLFCGRKFAVNVKIGVNIILAGYVFAYFGGIYFDRRRYRTFFVFDDMFIGKFYRGNRRFGTVCIRTEINGVDLCSLRRNVSYNVKRFFVRLFTVRY